jgi:UrcA family protein
MLKIACAAAFAVAIAAPAFAEDGAWRVGNDQIHVIDSRLDPATAVGRAKLLAHVETAAVRLCRDRNGTDRRRCFTDTVAQTAQGRGGAPLMLAMRERDDLRLAGSMQTQAGARLAYRDHDLPASTVAANARHSALAAR